VCAERRCAMRRSDILSARCYSSRYMLPTRDLLERERRVRVSHPGIVPEAECGPKETCLLSPEEAGVRRGEDSLFVLMLHIILREREREEICERQRGGFC